MLSVKVVKLVRTGLVLVGMLSANSGWSATLTDAEILNRTAQLRTLAVSTARHYVNAAGGIEIDESRQSLTDASQAFDDNLRLLKMHAPNTYARNGLKQLDREWSDYSQVLTQQPANQRVERLIESSSKLVFLADSLLNNWRGLASDRDLEALNLAHMQAMLSERIGLLYGAHYYGLKDDWVLGELNATLFEYEKGLNFLTRFLDNEASVVANLEQVTNQWTYAKEGFARFNQGHYLPKLIAVTMDSMEAEMSKMAIHYSTVYEERNNSMVTLSVPGLAANIE